MVPGVIGVDVSIVVMVVPPQIISFVESYCDGQSMTLQLPNLIDLEAAQVYSRATMDRTIGS